ncbi:hypothetical protein B5F07_15000 [Lachnoclostridium sp. An169]|uniref:hypothetical protein n=1 Tax=Lachnoclostridium sp. An169 TaxID=1965569 RepID=UPI000B37C5B8|nr:hypothetical protein [Lachnoclostridium sp. An169]OUP82083.1 hypothetical protein B5F07_15000 [Lachnoclostridium sp. An169]
MKNGEENTVIQNLLDAGCGKKFIENFLTCRRKGEVGKQLKLLSGQRDELLTRVHEEEKKINCLDYLVYQIEKEKH